MTWCVPVTQRVPLGLSERENVSTGRLLETLGDGDGDGGDVVVVVAFGEEVGASRAAVDGDAEEVFAGRDAGDVNPLAVEVGAVGVRPADGDALVVAGAWGGAGI